MKYTFTFGPENESKFKRILARLEDTDYTMIEDVTIVDPENERYSDRQVILDMESEAALTFRMGMKDLKIRRERTEEELAKEAEIEEKTTRKITIKVDGMT